MKKLLVILWASLLLFSFCCTKQNVIRQQPIGVFDPHENTLMKVCVKDGVFYYPTNEDPGAVNFRCVNPQEVVWEEHQLPIRVGTTIEEMEPFIYSAMQTWNALIGREIFVFQKYGFDVAIFPAHKQRGTNLAWAKHKMDYGRLTGEIRIMPLLLMYDKKYWEETLVHELGHILGLAHDPDKRDSIMHPNSDGRYITAADLLALRKLYNPKALTKYQE